MATGLKPPVIPDEEYEKKAIEYTLNWLGIKNMEHTLCQRNHRDATSKANTNTVQKFLINWLYSPHQWRSVTFSTGYSIIGCGRVWLVNIV